MAKISNKCSACGAKLEHDDEKKLWSCPYCGMTYSEEIASDGNSSAKEKSFGEKMDKVVGKFSVPEEDKLEGKIALNKYVAILLTICFGWCGAHKFYERKIFAGLIYFFSFGLFGLGWLIDTVKSFSYPETYYVDDPDYKKSSAK